MPQHDSEEAPLSGGEITFIARLQKESRARDQLRALAEKPRNIPVTPSERTAMSPDPVFGEKDLLALEDTDLPPEIRLPRVT